MRLYDEAPEFIMLAVKLSHPLPFQLVISSIGQNDLTTTIGSGAFGRQVTRVGGERGTERVEGRFLQLRKK